jgi:FkbM family methyltransferase
MQSSLAHRAIRKLDRAARFLSPRLWAELAIATRNKTFEAEYWLLPRLVSGGVAVDVGANEGLFSYYMAKTAERVHAFEPNPACLPRLRRLVGSRVSVHGCGLSDHDGIAELRFDPRKTGFGSIDPANRLDIDGLDASASERIQIHTLDSFALRGVTFIKIDVEGHEAAVIRGALATITACRPALLIESELRHNAGAFSELVSTLRPLGYRVGYWDDGRVVPVDTGDLPALQGAHGRYVNNFLFQPPERSL